MLRIQLYRQVLLIVLNHHQLIRLVKLRLSFTRLLLEMVIGIQQQHHGEEHPLLLHSLVDGISLLVLITLQRLLILVQTMQLTQLRQFLVNLSTWKEIAILPKMNTKQEIFGKL